MAIRNPGELRRFLDELGIRPKKRLSQNFLIDGNIIKKIVNAAALSSEDQVLEIGPGPGSLTEVLLEAGAHVIAVEKDDLLASALTRLDTPDNRLQVVTDDILNVSLDTLGLPSDQKGKVIANLPYHLTTPILARLIPRHDLFSTVVVMVQKEVAERIVAQPRTKSYSSFSVFLRYHSRPRYAFTVKRTCFFPPPKVDSAIIVLELRPPPPVSDPEQFFLMVRTAFGQRRKMMRSSLKKIYQPSDVEQALVANGHSLQARPEELSLEELIGVFEKLMNE